MERYLLPGNAGKTTIPAIIFLNIVDFDKYETAAMLGKLVTS